MKKVIQQSKEDIPYFGALVSFYNHVKARPPLDKDFDIREIDPEVLKSYDYVLKIHQSMRRVVKASINNKYRVFDFSK